MQRIVLAGFGDSLLQAFELLKNDFDIIAVIKDYERFGNGGEDFDEFFVNNQVEIMSIKSLKDLKPDLLFVINYNKIIQEEDIKDIFGINLHIGILPKYRGNSANAWAILNGEREVGYTIHEISNILDGGDIYYIFKYEILENQTYYHAKNAMLLDIQENLCSNITRILNGELKRISQEGKEFVYASKLKPEDGFIKSWDLSNNEIFRKHIIFAKPLGTGLVFEFKENYYEISRISSISNFAESRGIAGSVVMKNQDGSTWIKTKDNAISIDELVLNGEIIKPSCVFKIGDRL